MLSCQVSGGAFRAGARLGQGRVWGWLWGWGGGGGGDLVEFGSVVFDAILVEGLPHVENAPHLL
jgi:uncharacterized membrane protein